MEWEREYPAEGPGYKNMKGYPAAKLTAGCGLPARAGFANFERFVFGMAHLENVVDVDPQSPQVSNGCWECAVAVICGIGLERHCGTVDFKLGDVRAKVVLRD